MATTVEFERSVKPDEMATKIADRLDDGWTFLGFISMSGMTTAFFSKAT